MPYDLERFLSAQNPIYGQVLQELRAGQKRGHWMWFIFPQLAGLGHSSTARFFAIESLNEAVAYATHPILGTRLDECTTLVNAIAGRSIVAIFGSIDAMKFRSSMTLFSKAAADGPFTSALEKYFAGELDQRSLDLLARTGMYDAVTVDRCRRISRACRPGRISAPVLARGIGRFPTGGFLASSRHEQLCNRLISR